MQPSGGEPIDLACRICGNRSGNRRWPTREMMFGTREPFDYLECRTCGALQLIDPPADTARYYPSDYYSLQRLEPEKTRWFAALGRRLALGLALRRGRVFGSMARVAPLPEWLPWIRGYATSSSSILDFGCGSGDVLLSLRKNGFTKVAGFEPNLPAPIDYGNGVVVHNALESMRGRTFELVLVNHAFEHDHDPDRALAELLDFVTADGYIVLRMPLADSYAWRTYRGDWVQLDPPRHLVIQTRASIEILATRHGLEVVDEVRDSTEFQFAGSEQYRRRIPLRDARRETLFSTEELAAFRTRAERLNREGQGDQGRVVLRRSHAA